MGGAIDGVLTDYVVRRTSRRGSLGFGWRDGGVVVFAPKRMAGAAIAETLATHSGFLCKFRDRARRAEVARPRLADGMATLYRGEALTLRVVSDLLADGVVERLGGALVARLPLGEADREGRLRAMVRAWLCARAAEVLPDRVRHFAKALGRVPSAVALSDARTRWGSCSSSGRIRIGWRLVMADPALADYVCAHEACHLLEMNHSPAFWRLVEGLAPDWRVLRKRLRRIGAGLDI